MARTAQSVEQVSPPGSEYRQTSPDVAVAVLPLIYRLRDDLRGLVRSQESSRRWGVPPLFFFTPEFPQESGQIAHSGFESRDLEIIDRLDDVVTILSASLEARRAARAVPGFLEAVRSVQHYSRIRGLAELLAVADDQIVRVIHIAAQAGYRVRVHGVADMAQLHILLADALIGSGDWGFLPGTRPDPSVVAAFRDQPASETPASAVFQIYRLAALRSDGTLPPGIAGCDYWFWGSEWLTSLPSTNNELVILLGDLVVPMNWDAVRRLSRVSASVEVIEVMKREEVVSWLAEHTPGKTQNPVGSSQLS